MVGENVLGVVGDCLGGEEVRDVHRVAQVLQVPERNSEAPSPISDSEEASGCMHAGRGQAKEGKEGGQD